MTFKKSSGLHFLHSYNYNVELSSSQIIYITTSSISKQNWIDKGKIDVIDIADTKCFTFM